MDAIAEYLEDWRTVLIVVGIIYYLVRIQKGYLPFAGRRKVARRAAKPEAPRKPAYAGAVRIPLLLLGVDQGSPALDLLEEILLRKTSLKRLHGIHLPVLGLSDDSGVLSPRSKDSDEARAGWPKGALRALCASQMEGNTLNSAIVQHDSDGLVGLMRKVACNGLLVVDGFANTTRLLPALKVAARAGACLLICPGKRGEAYHARMVRLFGEERVYLMPDMAASKKRGAKLLNEILEYTQTARTTKESRAARKKKN